MIDTPYVRGAEKLRQRIATIRKKTGLPKMVDEIGVLLHRRTMDRFDRGVDPDGVPWQPLAISTLARKRQAGAGEQGMLVRSGRLRASIRLIRGGAGAMYTNTGAGIRIGIQDREVAKYARYQQEGVPGRIPARRILGIGRLDVKAVDALMRRRAVQLERSL